MLRLKNSTNELQNVRFADGSSKFFLRGETYITDKEVVRRTSGIKVEELEQEQPPVNSGSDVNQSQVEENNVVAEEEKHPSPTRRKRKTKTKE